MWLSWLFGAAALVFPGMATAALFQIRHVRRLPALPASTAPEDPVRCSVVVAARDEEARIEATVRRLLAQRGVELEVIVVDDRSTDQTSEILSRLAREDSRLRQHRVESLPEGWLGKCHACHLGAAMAQSEWILFTDADCWLEPDVIRRAVLSARSEHAEHVTLVPGTVLPGAAARAWYLMFLISLAGWISGVNTDRRRSHVGIGAFNLVLASAYRRSGGYEALRLTVVDDIKLGLLLRRTGSRTRAFLGFGDVECHWGTTVGSLVKIMEKNYFAVTDYRTALVVMGSMVMVMLLGTVLAGALSGTVAGLAAGLSPLALCVPGLVLARRCGWSWSCALLIPCMVPVFLHALVNSTVVTLMNGGIRWRDTFYPLEQLRKGTVR